MKAKLLSILLAGATALTFTSCDDYFDDVPDNATSLEAVFANRGQSLKWLSNIYTYTCATTRAPMVTGQWHQ